MEHSPAIHFETTSRYTNEDTRQHPRKHLHVLLYIPAVFTEYPEFYRGLRGDWKGPKGAPLTAEREELLSADNTPGVYMHLQVTPRPLPVPHVRGTYVPVTCSMHRRTSSVPGAPPPVHDSTIMSYARRCDAFVPWIAGTAHALPVALTKTPHPALVRRILRSRNSTSVRAEGAALHLLAGSRTPEYLSHAFPLWLTCHDALRKISDASNHTAVSQALYLPTTGYRGYRIRNGPFARPFLERVACDARMPVLLTPERFCVSLAGQSLAGPLDGSAYYLPPRDEETPDWLSPYDLDLMAYLLYRYHAVQDIPVTVLAYTASLTCEYTS